MQKFKLYFIWLAAVFILAGCATRPPTQSLTWAKQQKQLAKISAWQINGGVSLHFDKQSIITNFSWQQKEDQYVITLSSALGLFSVKLEGNANGVTFWQSADEKFSATTAEQLMQQQLGWSLPVTSLRYWVLGLPEPKHPYQATFDQNQQLATLKQQGWYINYQRFVQVNNLFLPEKILLTNQSINVKIVIKNWQI